MQLFFKKTILKNVLNTVFKIVYLIPDTMASIQLLSDLRQRDTP